MRAHFLCTELRLLLTAYSQLTGDIMQTNIEESDVPMVQVSEHWGARESHALWQGRIFTVEQFKAVCGYGEPSNPDHIYSYNCRHTHYPYWPGISEPIAYQREPGPFTVNGRRYTYYEATQKQRSMERQIRALKREVNAGGDKATLGSEIRQRTQEYKAFSDACGIREKLERLHVLGYDRSTSAKVRGAMNLASQIKSAGGLSSSAKVHVPAQKISTESLLFDDAHINAERSHNVTRDQAVEWIRNSKMSVTVWGGRYERYYGSGGAVYVNTAEQKIRTAFSSTEFDSRVRDMLEVLSRYGY